MTDTLTEIFDKGPPRDIEAEAQVLGTLFLRHPGQRAEIIDKIPVEAFHDPVHQHIYRGMKLFGPHLDGADLYQRIRSVPNRPSGESTSYSIAILLLNLRAESRVKSAMVGYYIDKLITTHRQRERYDRAIKTLQQTAYNPNPGPSDHLLPG